MTFQEWWDQQAEEIQAIQHTLHCDRQEALKILLLMRLTGDLYEPEGWEDE